MGVLALSSRKKRTKIARTMFRLLLTSCLVGVSMSQYVDPAQAKILKEQRFNAGDGRFGSAYAQEDGVVFREESGPGGERTGQYSYVDQSGKTITVRYSAGVDGFKILEGAHVPTGANGQNSAAHDPNYREPAPAPVQQAAPAYQYNNNVQANNYVQPTQAPNPNRNPFINPDDPTHSNFRYNTNAANYAPGNSYSQQVNSVPPCADCAGANPFINPYDPSHQNGYVQPQPAPVQRAQPAQNSYTLNTQNNNNNYNAYTTQAPKRFF